MLNIQTLVEMYNRLAEYNPIRNNDIPEDWICVIHPSMERHILDLEDSKSLHYTVYLSVADRLQRIVGRKVFIQNTAPMDKIEYMSLATWASKYANEELAKIEYRQERKAELEFKRGISDYMAEG